MVKTMAKQVHQELDQQAWDLARRMAKVHGYETTEAYLATVLQEVLVDEGAVTKLFTRERLAEIDAASQGPVVSEAELDRHLDRLREAKKKQA